MRTLRIRLTAGFVSLLLFASPLTGQITEILDGSGDGAGNTFSRGRHIAVDAAGNAYVVGWASDNVFKVSPGGSITEILDASGDGNGNTLKNPLSIDVSSGGTAVVTGENSDNAFRITPSGVVTQIIDASGDGLGNIYTQPEDIAISDTTDNVYVACEPAFFPEGNVFRITPSGQITLILNYLGDGQGNEARWPRAVAVDASENVYVATGWPPYNVWKVTPSGQLSILLDETGDGAGNTFEHGRGIAVDGAGNVYVGGAASRNVFKITPGGVISEIFDEDGDGLGNVPNVIHEVAAGPFGNVFVATGTSFISTPSPVNSEDNVFRITPGGSITEIIDATGDGVAPLLGCETVAVDLLGNVFTTGFESSNAFKIEVPECFLVVGDAPGNAPFLAVNHLFETQVGPTIEDSQAVLMDSVPEFVLPTPSAAVALGGVGVTRGAQPNGASPPWMLDGHFAVQVLMWNPQVFPGQPEQYTAGLAVQILPNGQVVSTPYGSAQGGIDVWAEVDTNAQGQKVLRFPFSIDGM